MTTLPTVPVQETRPAEPVTAVAVAPAATTTTTTTPSTAVSQSGFAEALLAAALPVPAATTATKTTATTTADSELDGDSHGSEQEQTATAQPTLPVTPLSLALPLVPAAPPPLSANLGVFQGLTGVPGGSVSATARDSLPLPSATVPSLSANLAVFQGLTGVPGSSASVTARDSLPLRSTTVPSLLADSLSTAAAGLPARMAAQDDGAPPFASGPALSPLPAWLGHVQAAEPRTALPEWAPLTLPAGQPARWGESLRAALGERLAVQSMHGMDRALIRLDPPSFGSLEIAIRHEGGALTVQLVASHGEVVRQLQAIGDALRQDLSSRQYTQVAVEVREGAPGGGQGQGQGRSGRDTAPEGRTPGRALAEADGDGSSPFALAQG